MISKQRISTVTGISIFLLLGGLGLPAYSQEPESKSAKAEPESAAEEKGQSEKAKSKSSEEPSKGKESEEADADQPSIKELEKQLPPDIKIPKDAKNREEVIRALVREQERQKAASTNAGASAEKPDEAAASGGEGGSEGRQGPPVPGVPGQSRSGAGAGEAEAGTGDQEQSGDGTGTGDGSGEAEETDQTQQAEAASEQEAQQQQQQQMVQALNFPNMPFEQALNFYAELTGRIILRRTQVQNAPDSVVMVTNQPLTKEEAIEAFKTVFAMNGISLIPVGEKFLKVVSTGRAKSEGAPLSDVTPEDLKATGQFVTRVVELEYAPVEETAQVLQQFKSEDANEAVVGIESTQTVILRDYAPNVKRMLEMVEKIDVEIPLNIEMEVIPIKYALANEVAQVLGTLTPGGASGQLGGNQSRNRNFLSGGRGSSRLGSRGGRGRGQRNQRGGSDSSDSSSGSRGNFQQRLQRIVDRASQGEFQVLGETRIIPDARSNKLLVFARKEDMKMIKKIIEKIDSIRAQVLIEAVVMEVSVGKTRDLGISYFQNPQTSGNVTGAGGVDNGQSFFDFENFAGVAGTNALSSVDSGFNYFGQVGDDLEIAVNAVATSSDAKILQRPRIQTSHAEPAMLFVGETRPFVTGTIFGGRSGFGSTSQTIQREDIGVELQVLPLVNPDGLVVLDIRQTIEDIGGTVQIDGNPVPITTTRQAEASVAVRDGETIILGGMISDSKNKSDSGVPLLKDIPVLGHLFRSSSTDDQRRELIVLLRPTVLDTPQIASEKANQEIDKMPAVKEAGEEFKERRRRERKEYQKEHKSE